ncbi:MAG: hypothetical protein CMP27_11870 [Roseibacillus sp.]|nr:hypothetical protein [Roseibacillus sp.]
MNLIVVGLKMPREEEDLRAQGSEKSLITGWYQSYCCANSRGVTEMKIGFIVSTTLALLLAVVVVMGMGKVSKLEEKVAEIEQEKPAKSSTRLPSSAVASAPLSPSRPSGPAKSTRVSADSEAVEDDQEDRGDERRRVLGDMFRQWAESDAGKRMEETQNKRKARKVFSPLIEELALSEEDRDYFLGVAGASANADDALWGELMTAGDDDRESILEKWEQENAERSAAMREFLNDDSDWERYQNYEARLEEYEQVEGLRRSMEGAGVPLTAEQEAQLVEVMYDARQETGMDDRWRGRGALDQLSEPGIAERLEADWQSNQEAMSSGLNNVLSPEQVEAFNSSQSRTIRQVTQGIRMMEAFTGGVRRPE